jgi:acetyl esterase
MRGYWQYSLMPLHAETRALLDLMEETGVPTLDSQEPALARATRAEMAPPITEECYEIVEIDAGGVPARLYRPEPTGRRPGLLIWFHGGGWVIGDLDSHENVCRVLTNLSGHAVLSVAYRLAPEDPFPAGLGDCIEATRWAHAHVDELGVDADLLAVGGDSAGANLAAVVCHVAPAPIKFQMLIYPVTDLRRGTDSYIENAEGYFLTASSMQWFLEHYISGGQGSPEDPRVSPLLANDAAFAQCPPALVITAEYDPLRDEGVQYAERLADAGVVTSHVHFPGQTHAFFSFPHLLAEARSAQALAAQSLRDAFNPPVAPVDSTPKPPKPHPTRTR